MNAAHSDSFSAPVAPVDGYLPIEDFGLVGDGSTAALVGRDGAVSWLCVPRFDDEPLFCSILDAHRGGRFRLAPAETVAARQRYEPASGVLTTELRSPPGSYASLPASRCGPAPTSPRTCRRAEASCCARSSCSRGGSAWRRRSP